MMSNKNHFKSATSFQGKVLENYQYQINLQNKLLSIVKSALPAHLSDHVLYCVNSGNKISVYTDAAVWSSQLRFYHSTMLNAIKPSALGRFDSLQIKIIPPTNKLEQKTAKKIIPSTENIDLLVSQAENQTDEKLKTALQKLAKTFSKRSK